MDRSTSCLLRAREVQRKTGLSRSGLYRAVARGAFPAPVQLATGRDARTVAWVDHEVQAWIDACIERRSS